jgi:hypothetical protein
MSLRKGDAVIVHGRLRGADTWTPEQGPPSTSLNVEAVLIGHDLTRGRSQFFKDNPRRDEETPDPSMGEANDPGGQAGGLGTPPDFVAAWAAPGSDPVRTGPTGRRPISRRLAQRRSVADHG